MWIVCGTAVAILIVNSNGNSTILDTFSLLALAFGLGLLHALDADHVMAVTGLAATQSKTEQCLRFCRQWALGHGAAMLLIGSAVVLLGLAIPESLSAHAESLVGAVLIGLALWVFYDLYRRRLHLQFHQHGELPQHAHWLQKNTSSHSGKPHGDDHSALLVGLLHGTAGAAPFLLLLPLSSQISPFVSFGYILIFCTGVVCAMLLFGGLLGHLYDFLGRHGARMINGLRAVVALSSLAFGLHLLGAY